MSVPVNSSWNLTFDDQLNGASLNTSKWTANWLGSPTAITKPINPAETAAYDPAQATVSDGSLHLKAIASPVSVGGVSYADRSGMVQSHEKFEQAYGYFEAKVFLPAPADRSPTGPHSGPTAKAGRQTARWTSWKGSAARPPTTSTPRPAARDQPSTATIPAGTSSPACGSPAASPSITTTWRSERSPPADINDVGNTLANATGGNVLNGGSGNDSIGGGMGLDTIVGGSGKDLLTGNSGADQFSSPSDSGTALPSVT